MALIGIDHIEHFEAVRASGAIAGGAEDLTCPYYIANWFAYALTQAGHEVKFLRAEQNVDERDMRDTPMYGGDDAKYADSVDLFFILTHGDYSGNECLLLYDTQVNSWIGHSKQWRFGDSCRLKWLMIWGCETIDRSHVTDLLSVFQRLHLICGAYSYMYDSFTVDEAGTDTADDMLSGDTVCDSWGDGISDWWVENHPMVLSVELEWTYNNGNILWEETVIGCDHLLGSGYTFPDIKPADVYYMAYEWWDGGLYDG
jgi:hypothetical protein